MNSVGGFNGVQGFAPIETPLWEGSLEQKAERMPEETRLSMLKTRTWQHVARWLDAFAQRAKRSVPAPMQISRTLRFSRSTADCTKPHTGINLCREYITSNHH